MPPKTLSANKTMLPEEELNQQ